MVPGESGEEGGGVSFFSPAKFATTKTPVQCAICGRWIPVGESVGTDGTRYWHRVSCKGVNSGA
jgi:hypothetical protein